MRRGVTSSDLYIYTLILPFKDPEEPLFLRNLAMSSSTDMTMSASPDVSPSPDVATLPSNSQPTFSFHPKYATPVYEVVFSVWTIFYLIETSPDSALG